MAVKKFNFKIPGGQTAAVLKIDKLQTAVSHDDAERGPDLQNVLR